jgi:hypothetical protein
VITQKIDGIRYSTGYIMTVAGYEAPLYELRQDYCVHMTRKAWEKGIPGSCTNCGVAVAGRDQGLRGIWIGRRICYLLFKIPGTKIEACFKAWVPKRTRLALNANDEERIDECPTGPIWFHAMKPGSIDKARLRAENRASRAGMNDGGPRHHDSISGVLNRPKIDDVAKKWRDGTGKVKIRRI